MILPRFTDKPALINYRARAARRRAALVAAGALVGWSRIALGVHFPSDVAAALLLGSLCALLSQIATRQLANAWHHRSLARRVAPSGPVP